VGEYDQFGCQGKILQWRMKDKGLESCVLVKRVGDGGIGFIRTLDKTTGQKKECIFVTSTVLNQQGIHTSKTKQL